MAQGTAAGGGEGGEGGEEAGEGPVERGEGREYTQEEQRDGGVSVVFVVVVCEGLKKIKQYHVCLINKKKTSLKINCCFRSLFDRSIRCPGVWDVGLKRCGSVGGDGSGAVLVFLLLDGINTGCGARVGIYVALVAGERKRNDGARTLQVERCAFHA